jgi:hypothetical protein
MVEFIFLDKLYFVNKKSKSSRFREPFAKTFYVTQIFSKKGNRLLYKLINLMKKC